MPYDFRFHSLCNAFSILKMVIKLGSFTVEFVCRSVERTGNIHVICYSQVIYLSPAL